MNRLTALVLALSLFVPEVLLPQQKAAQSAEISPQASPVAASAPQTPVETQGTQSVRPHSAARRHSYVRETNPRHRPGISKKELAFMGAIAGTSMGIGALAGGAKGLAIGAMVGGWGAYAGHRLWNWIR